MLRRFSEFRLGLKLKKKIVRSWAVKHGKVPWTGSGGNRPPLDGSVRSFLVEKKRIFLFLSVRSFFFSSFSRRSHDGDPPSLSLRGRTLGSFHPTREKGVGRASGRRPRESSRLLARRTRYIYKILQHFLSSSSFFLSFFLVFLFFLCEQITF